MTFEQLFAVDPVVAVLAFVYDERDFTDEITDQMSFSDLLSLASTLCHGNIGHKAFELARQKARSFDEHLRIFNHERAQNTSYRDMRWLREQVLIQMTGTATTLEEWCCLYKAAHHPEWRDELIQTSDSRIMKLAITQENLCFVVRQFGTTSSLGSWAINRLKEIRAG